MLARKSASPWYQSFFFLSIFVMSCAYLVFQYFYITTSALAADEFVFARHIYEYTWHIPYQDFAPYKTTLGYYLLSIPFFISHTLLGPIIAAKYEIALLNIAGLALTAWWSCKFFDKRAVLLCLAAIMANEIFLLYGTDLRVDMLTCWFCLFSGLALLQHRFSLSGILLGSAFLISQKALWYLIALNGGMLICLLAFTQSSYQWRSILTFNGAFAVVIALYVAAWSMISSPHIVLSNLFYEAYIQAGIDWYLSIYLICWQLVLQHGPLLFFLWPVTFIALFVKKVPDQVLERRIFIMISSSIALVLFVLYKQAFPYNFVFTLPALFLLYAEFLSFLYAQKNKDTFFAIANQPLFYGICVYIIILTLLMRAIEMHLIYYTILLMPIALYFLFQNRNALDKLNFYVFICLFTITGIVYPLYLSTRIAINLNGNYQKTMLAVTSQLLANEGDYIGGIPYFYAKEQPVEGMKNLIGPALEYLEQPNDKLAPLLLPSLYLATTNQDNILAEFETQPVKVILNNWRMIQLPEKIAHYIENNYQHYYGSIYLYAPLITPDQLTFHLKFAGQYRLETKSAKKLRLDNKRVRAGQLLTLKSGDHTSSAHQSYRLVFIPSHTDLHLDPQYQDDDYLRMLKAILS